MPCNVISVNRLEKNAQVLRLLAFFLLLAPAAQTSAGLPPEAPIVLVMNERAYGVPDGFGLVGAMIGKSTNNVAQAQVEAFKQQTAGIAWADLAAEEFSCISMGDKPAAECRKVFVADGLESLVGLFDRYDAPKLILVELVQTYLDPMRYRARAVIHELTRGKKSYREDRLFTVLFENFLPPSLWQKTPAEAAEYWRSGTPSRLEADARRSLKELHALAEYVDALKTEPRKTPPEWKQLPKVATLVESKRAHCVGMPCRNVRVLEERGERTWLVNDKPLIPFYGPSAASLDANAMLNQTSLYVLVQFPYL